MLNNITELLKNYLPVSVNEGVRIIGLKLNKIKKISCLINKLENLEKVRIRRLFKAMIFLLIDIEKIRVLNEMPMNRNMTALLINMKPIIFLSLFMINAKIKNAILKMKSYYNHHKKCSCRGSRI